ncbi:MAG: BON domain-containing protein, partial [Sphingobacteriales bacterium]
VTLSGQVDSLLKKVTAEKATKRVAGVRAIAQDIEIGVSPGNPRSDSEIAQAILKALQWNTAITEEKIQIKVENGNVELEGKVDWSYQSVSAESAIENLAGVRSIQNNITIKPKLTCGEIREKIDLAFRRSATIDSAKIIIEVSGSHVTLSGTVRSFAEKTDAEKAAWSAPGITELESNIDIEAAGIPFEIL